jgi:hypothetical protein
MSSNIERVEETPKSWWQPGTKEIRWIHTVSGYTLAVVTKLKDSVRINTVSFSAITIDEAEDIHKALGMAVRQGKQFQKEIDAEKEKAVDNA